MELIKPKNKKSYPTESLIQWEGGSRNEFVITAWQIGL